MAYLQKSAVSTDPLPTTFSGLWPPPEFRLAASGMAWKGEENEAVIAVPADEVKWAQWFRVGRNFQLRVGLKDRRRETFDGFVREVRRKPSFFQGKSNDHVYDRTTTNLRVYSSSILA